MTCSGTHKGEYAGIGPTGNRVEMNDSRYLSESPAAKWWNSGPLWITCGLMQQLGAIPSGPAEEIAAEVFSWTSSKQMPATFPEPSWVIQTNRSRVSRYPLRRPTRRRPALEAAAAGHSVVGDPRVHRLQHSTGAVP